LAARRTPAQNKIALCPVTTRTDHFKRRAQPCFVIDNLAAVFVYLWRYPVKAIVTTLNAGFSSSAGSAFGSRFATGRLTTTLSPRALFPVAWQP
jgi:hypothetical protein